MTNEVAPPYSKNAATDLAEGILDVINGSRQQAFMKEVKELGDDIKSMLNCVEELHSLLLQKSTSVNLHKKFSLEAWKAEEVKCRAHIRLIRDTVGEMKINVTHPFVKLWAPMAAEESDEDVLAEFEGFSERLAGIKTPDIKFDSMFDIVQAIIQGCNDKLAIAEASNGDIQRLKEEIEELEKKNDMSASLIEELVPDVFKAFGLNGYSHKVPLLLACGPQALVRAIKGLVQGGTLTQKDTKEEDKKDNDRKDDEEHGQGDQKKEDSNNEDATNLLSLLSSPMEMEGDDSNDPQNAEVEAMAEFKSLWDAAETKEGYENKLIEKRKQLDEQVRLQEKSKSDQDRWHSIVYFASELELKISFIVPRLEISANVAKAVKEEVDNHVAFLQSPDCKDRAKRINALEEISLARGMYTLLDHALENFVTQL
ncbi:hypothetical protein GYMLUDRAFT_245968 [Collybiopsis luxurians FD-317 M1]|uniref:Uncharacterized protein n=1 Tax=Collybiopsis luxurians FD-317 M1 TaxID=944289 RepID=A0A0D0B5E8_9AGAR|nr:hypothetical protein GYMLUDRAFT_245968 [Collybiopsis luxurians FD-317 M1]